MKVLFINSVVDYGSTGKIVRDLANGLKQQGHDVLICFGRNVASDKTDTFDFSSKFFSMIHLIMSRLFGRHGLHSTLQTRKLIRKIKNFGPDVIHLHNLHGYYLNYKVLFNFLHEYDVKILWTLHDCWAFSGSAAHFDYYGCKKWDNGCVECENTKSYPRVDFSPRQQKNFNLKKEVFTMVNDMEIFCPSNWLRNLTSKTFLSKYNISTIYNGIDIDSFSIKDSSSSNGQINLLGVANDWSIQKGLYDFYELSKKLPKNYKLTLVGLTQKQKIQTPSNIVAVERTRNYDELIDFYKRADIYLNLSVEETMGLTTVEAMAVGTPVIVYDRTAVPEVVSEYTGVIIPAISIENLIDAIINFDFSKFDKQNISDHAKRFSKQNMITEYLEKYI